MKIKCLITDDEPLARDLLLSYIQKMDDLEIIGTCSNAIDAFGFMQKHKVDLLFLDIQMPKMSGLDLIRSLQERPNIIITTAYREYAVDGFELNVLDYMVKPISFERFLKGLAKYHQLHMFRNTTVPVETSSTYDQAYMFFKVNKELMKVFLKDIIYIESIKDYIKIVTDKKQFLTYHRISYMEEKLPENKFLRIHKSYIVSCDKIKSYNHESVTLDAVSLPIGRLFKQNVMNKIGCAE
jgi:DNA-binding LytR/AlgR family response regulator